MPIAIIRPEDLRLAMSHLAQANYATAVSAANLNAGKSLRPTSPVLPKQQSRFSRMGPQAFTGHEFPIAANEIEVQRDLSFGLTFALNSWLAGWAGAFAWDDVTSVQEGVTGHWTHTIRPSNLLASGGLMQAKTSSIYIDGGGTEASRDKAIYPSLAVVRFAISARRGENLQLSMDFIGSGKVDRATAVTLPALSSEVLFTGQQFKFERGDKGGGLTEFTERIAEWAFEGTVLVAAERGYTPNAATPADGKFRSQLRVLRRQFSLSWSEEIDRANAVAAGSLQSRMDSRTLTETKITVDSGVVAGTGTSNHKIAIRVPDHRIPPSDPTMDADGAVYAVTVPNEMIHRDLGIADSPVTITVDNDQPSYLV